MLQDTHTITLFKEKAAAVNTTLAETPTLADAVRYALRLCAEKTYRDPLLTRACGPDSSLARTFSAPGLPDALRAIVDEEAEKHGITLVNQNLRGHMNGIGVGFSIADMGIAETATCVLRCPDEDARLASMLCEAHVIALPTKRIAATSYDIENFLHAAMSGPMYTAFIAASSRTSDIERVLTQGAHGPLELHVVLTEEA